jgi:hypothetical protein
MRKSIFYRLFGLGKFPKSMVPILESEGMVLEEQGVSGSVTFRRFRAPCRFYSYRKSSFIGSLVITSQRFAAFAFSKPLINLSLEKAKLGLLTLSVPKRNHFLVKFDAEDFHDDWRGKIECRFSTELAALFLERLQLTDPDRAL